jgi:hypothetical protein
LRRALDDTPMPTRSLPRTGIRICLDDRIENAEGHVRAMP